MKLTLKRNHAQIRAALDDLIEREKLNQHQVQVQARVQAPKLLKLRVRRTRPDPVIPVPGCQDVFAKMGDEWGAMEPTRRFRVTLPDGTRLWHRAALREPDAGTIERPCDKPLKERRNPVPCVNLSRTHLSEALSEAHTERNRLVIVPRT